MSENASIKVACATVIWSPWDTVIHHILFSPQDHLLCLVHYNQTPSCSTELDPAWFAAEQITEKVPLSPGLEHIQCRYHTESSGNLVAQILSFYWACANSDFSKAYNSHIWTDCHGNGERHISDTKAAPLPNFKALLPSMGDLELFKESHQNFLTRAKESYFSLDSFLEKAETFWLKFPKIVSQMEKWVRETQSDPSKITQKVWGRVFKPQPPTFQAHALIRSTVSDTKVSQSSWSHQHITKLFIFVSRRLIFLTVFFFF